MATWTKLRDGSWGLRSTVKLAPGNNVTVLKRDGSPSTLTVGRSVWEGEGVFLYATGATAMSVTEDPCHTPKLKLRVRALGTRAHIGSSANTLAHPHPEPSVAPTRSRGGTPTQGDNLPPSLSYDRGTVYAAVYG